MSDKIRGAIFNMLGDIQDFTVLDAFSGTGALSFEAISRGAASVIAVEVDKAAATTITKNAITLGVVDEVKVIRANVSSWSDNNPDKVFDLVICDPPFDKLQTAIIQKLTWHVRQNGILVLSWPGSVAPPKLPQITQATAKSYGDAQILVYQKI